MEFEEGAVALRLHHRHLSLTASDHVDDLAGRFFGEVYRQEFDGLVGYAVDLVDDDLGLADLELVAFTAHGLDEDGEVQDASAVHDPAVGCLGGLDTQS